MKYAEIKGKDQKTLADMLKDKRDALRAFTFGSAGSKNRNVKEGHNIKKDIARILTEISATK